MSGEPRRLHLLSGRRRALLDAMLGGEGGEAAGGEPIRPRSRRAGETLPLSFAQERLWFLDQLIPGSPVYNTTSLLPLVEPVDRTALEGALNAVVERHESMRTTFVVRDGQPRQRVAPHLAVPLAVEDLTAAPAAERRRRAHRLIDEEARRPFDLARGPLLRATLFHLGDGEPALLQLVQHHIISDAWSLGILFQELGLLYAAFSRGEPSPLPDLPIQYGDYALWQRRHLTGEVLEGHLAYWRRKLDGLSGVLELPTDRPRPALQTFGGGLVPFSLPPALHRRLQAVGRGAQATAFMTMLAAFCALLHRYTGQRDLAVGTPIANRNRSDTEGLIGLFLNTLVLRTDLSGEPGFRRLVQRVRQVTLEAYEHGELPFEVLVDHLQPARNLNLNPLFQVFFVLQSAAAAPPEAPQEGSPEVAEGAPGVADPAPEDPRRAPAAAAPQPNTATAKFDLSLYLTDTGTTFEGLWEYNADLFDRTTLSRMSGHLSTLLEAMVAAPERPLGRLPLLTAAERQLLVEWNDTAAPPAAECLPHRLVEAQAAATPDAAAVVLGDEVVSYRELNARANRLARRLAGHGVGPEVPVAICAERSGEMVVALLAALKAGGVHMPLDPAFPAERLGFMIGDAGAPVVLAQSHLAAALPATAAAVLALDGEPPGGDGSDLGRSVAAEGLAYLIYTSGSTGTPKGVGMSQGTLSNLIAWQNALSPLPPGGRTAQFTAFTFDVSVLEVLSTLSTAGTLVLIPEAIRGDFGALARLLAAQRVGRLFMPFTALLHLAEAGGAAGAGLGLRQVISTGEALHVTEPVAALFARLPRCTLHNEYGPTETHFVTEHRLRGDPGRWPALPAIGRPIPNVEIHLLDRGLEPVPAGVPGELYAAGAAVARCYFRRPALTAERFLPHPGGGAAGARVYRTGDLARHLPGGVVEYLGRRDHQVKIRGFRIELGEVEVALAAHPRVREAVVVAREIAGRRERDLVGYAVPEGEPAPTVTELRAYLLERLPGYMVPTTFMLLDELPLGATGKVARRRLPAPDAARPDLAQRYVAPSGPVEEELAAIWALVLGLDRVGAQDNFFELGGHSLLATQAATRVREAFGVELPLRRLFELPTVAELAVAIVQSQVETADAAEMDSLLAEIEEMSSQEVEALLGQEPAP